MCENVGSAPLGTGMLNLILALKLKCHARLFSLRTNWEQNENLRRLQKIFSSDNEKVFSALSMSTDCVTKDLYQKWEVSSVDK